MLIGSAPQQWHSDGPHMHHSQQLGPHALNVFVPLVALTPANGPTEFVPTTHLHWDADERPVCLTADAGDAILFDYRTKHRGLANRGASRARSCTSPTASPGGSTRTTSRPSATTSSRSRARPRGAAAL